MTPTLYAEPDTHHDLTPPDDHGLADSEPRPNNRVIGLHGFAQSGKDTVATGLLRYGYERVALADPIRNIALKINPITHADTFNGSPYRVRLEEIIDDLGWDDAKRTIPEVRRLLQVIGTEVGRDLLGPDVWVNMALAKIMQKGFYVITDVRFRNEVDMVRSVNGMLIKIVRPGVDSVNAHVSDAGLPDAYFDVVIQNDGTIPELYEKVYQAVRLG